MNPPGSCPANPNGPIPDGQQLVDITQNPGSGGGGNSSGGGGGGGGNSSRPVSTGNQGGSTKISTPAAKNPTPTSTPNPPNPQGGDFKLQNGKDAQKLNAQFSQLTADSSCTGQSSLFQPCNYHRFIDSRVDGQNACVSGKFAQCAGGKFSTTSCSGNLVCAALPLVNSPGTSITCTTQQDALTRIANTGAQGGLTGSG